MFNTGDIVEGRYIIKEKIGSGGIGTVYKAYHINMKIDVALKLVENISINEINQRSEVDLLKKLKSRYLPTVYDFAVVDGAAYIVMEYIDGHNIEELVKLRKNFDEEAVIRCGKQLCDAIRELHSQNPPIIHGDIKPSNVMLTVTDIICLIDFNISSLMNGDYAVVRGYSNEYAAAEQIATDKKVVSENTIPNDKTHFLLDSNINDNSSTKILLDDEIDNYEDKSQAYMNQKNDIFGIGTVLYYMLTGHPPINGKADFTGVEVSEKMKYVIGKAMSINQADRFQTAEEMKAALENEFPHKSKCKKSKVKDSSSKKKPLIIAAAAIIVIVSVILMLNLSGAVSFEIPFTSKYIWLDNGMLRIDEELIGKTENEIEKQLKQELIIEDYPWWGDSLSSSYVTYNGITTTFIFDKNGKLAIIFYDTKSDFSNEVKTKADAIWGDCTLIGSKYQWIINNDIEFNFFMEYYLETNEQYFRQCYGTSSVLTYS